MQRANRLSTLTYWPYAILQTLVSKCFHILQEKAIFTPSSPLPWCAECPQIWKGFCFVGHFVCFCWQSSYSVLEYQQLLDYLTIIIAIIIFLTHKGVETAKLYLLSIDIVSCHPPVRSFLSGSIIVIIILLLLLLNCTFHSKVFYV